MIPLLYYTYIDSADYSLLEALLDRPDFPADRRTQIQSRRPPERRAQSLAATVLLAQAMGDFGYKNLPPTDDSPFSEGGVCFCTWPIRSLTCLPAAWPVSPTGQPFPGGVTTAKGRVFVSVTHSGRAVLAAAAAQPVGVDAQSLATLDGDRWQRLDERVRHPAEEPAPDAPSFALRWAAKEAALKATGEGLSRPMTTLRVENDCVRMDSGDTFRLWQTMYGDTAIAVAVADTIPTG